MRDKRPIGFTATKVLCVLFIISSTNEKLITSAHLTDQIDESQTQENKTYTYDSNNNDQQLLTPKFQFGATCASLRFVSRREWGAKQPGEPLRMFTRLPARVFVHQAWDGRTCADLNSCSIRMQAIQVYHQHKKNWPDISYNLLIAGDGTIYEGVGVQFVGYHTLNYNYQSIGIALIGTFHDTYPTPEMDFALENLIDCLVESGYLRPNYSLHGHRDARCTICPGDAAYSRLSQMANFQPGPLARYSCPYRKNLADSAPAAVEGPLEMADSSPEAMVADIAPATAMLTASAVGRRISEPTPSIDLFPLLNGGEKRDVEVAAAAAAGSSEANSVANSSYLARVAPSAEWLVSRSSRSLTSESSFDLLNGPIDQSKKEDEEREENKEEVERENDDQRRKRGDRLENKASQQQQVADFLTANGREQSLASSSLFAQPSNKLQLARATEVTSGQQGEQPQPRRQQQQLVSSNSSLLTTGGWRRPTETGAGTATGRLLQQQQVVNVDSNNQLISLALNSDALPMRNLLSLNHPFDSDSDSYSNLNLNLNPNPNPPTGGAKVYGHNYHSIDRSNHNHPHHHHGKEEKEGGRKINSHLMLTTTTNQPLALVEETTAHVSVVRRRGYQSGHNHRLPFTLIGGVGGGGWSSLSGAAARTGSGRKQRFPDASGDDSAPLRTEAIHKGSNNAPQLLLLNLPSGSGRGGGGSGSSSSSSSSSAAASTSSSSSGVIQPMFYLITTKTKAPGLTGSPTIIYAPTSISSGSSGSGSRSGNSSSSSNGFSGGSSGGGVSGSSGGSSSGSGSDSSGEGSRDGFGGSSSGGEEGGSSNGSGSGSSNGGSGSGSGFGSPRGGSSSGSGGSGASSGSGESGSSGSPLRGSGHSAGSRSELFANEAEREVRVAVAGSEESNIKSKGRENSLWDKLLDLVQLDSWLSF